MDLGFNFKQLRIMNIIQLVRLLYRNMLLLIGSALIMALAVFLFLSNIPKTYESKTTIYTGIGSGMNLEGAGSASDFYATNMALDNLMNIISSRETLEEVSLRLLAKHLLLDKADPKYISQENYDELMEIVPDDVMQLLVRKKKETIEPRDEKKKEVKVKPPTEKKKSSSDNSKKRIYHYVQPDETLYSISRRYGIPLITLMRINNLNDNLIRAGDKLLISLPDDTNEQPDLEQQYQDDENIYYIVENKDDLESIALKFNTSVKNLIIWNSLQERQIPAGINLVVGKKNDIKETENSPPYLEDTQIDASNSGNESIVREDVGQSSLEKRINEEFESSYELEETLKNFYEYKERNDTNFIYGILNYKFKHYSIYALQKISVARLEDSDIIEISYKADDPGIAQYTLILLSNIFINNYKLIKENQSDKVVKYFEEQVQKANDRLQKAEDELLKFNKDNNIINYYEQTKYMAAKKEDLDGDYQDEKMELAASLAAYKKLEDKLASHSEIVINREEILKKTEELAGITEKYTYLETEQSPDEITLNEIVRLKRKANKLKEEIRKVVDIEYAQSNSIEGIPIEKILTQWLESVIAYEESKARLNAYADRKAEVERAYVTFAPLGAKLKRIEREINVSEQEYLSLLHSLNLSKLKQQNIELSSNIKPVGFPYYPLSPNSQKRKFLMAAAALIGFIFCFIILYVNELLDKSIHNPEQAMTFTSLQTASAIPIIPKRFRRIDYPFIINKLSEQIIQHLKLTTSKISDRPILIAMVSTRDTEGKTRISNELIRRIRESGDKTLYINHSNDTPAEEHLDADNYSYIPNLKYSELKDVQELCPAISSLKAYRYIFIEFPSLIYNSYPIEIVKKLDATYLVFHARKSWSDADDKAFQNFKGLLKHDAFLILNNTKLDVIEDFISEIPKKRSAFRIFIKKLLSPNVK